MLGSPRDVTEVELTGMVASIAHLAYHLGAIRQIDKDARGPRGNVFVVEHAPDRMLPLSLPDGKISGGF